MNAHQKLYFAQAVSDWEIFRFLKGKASCHRLHYLQMCTEKLSKAYSYKAAPTGKAHGGFPSFLRKLSKEKNLWRDLGFRRLRDFDRFVSDCNEFATGIDLLAPQLAGDGPNPEYPWPPPPKEATHAPVHFSFPIWQHLENTLKGQKFLALIARLFKIFPERF